MYVYIVDKDSLKNALKLKSCPDIVVLRCACQNPIIYGDCDRDWVIDIEAIRLVVVVMTAKWNSNDSASHCKEGHTHE